MDIASSTIHTRQLVPSKLTDTHRAKPRKRKDAHSLQPTHHTHFPANSTPPHNRSHCPELTHHPSISAMCLQSPAGPTLLLGHKSRWQGP
ncbi:hypothetical protein BCR34DRAFT_567032 [Clohesyomyces aquaticus]|uniref:Uncharacterized protein n=1 Tax=Clohesyomyces aquaticus TaxID=1231657 RepID=A0A1Y1ZJC0_9PLEO|nr:hypothetical protein BCR34DRAFT_567032 [Clohesyomyces aquaticus]